MPRFDGTGPLGEGPMTGRGRGFCTVQGGRGSWFGRSSGYGSGFGRGRGAGQCRGFGRGMGTGSGQGRGRGFGWR